MFTSVVTNWSKGGFGERLHGIWQEPADIPPSRTETLDPTASEVLEQIHRAARVESPVLVRGEPKGAPELVARAIHGCSRRGASPFVAVHMATLPAPLVDGELFGRLKGVGTSEQGRFEAAAHGTLFIDEVADLQYTAQARLLDALESRRIAPLGSSRDRAIEVRVIAATVYDLESLVDCGQFREDLYYVLSAVTICVPAISAQDPQFVWRLLKDSGAVDQQGEPLVASDTGDLARCGLWAHGPAVLAGTLASLEREAVLRALEEHHGNRTRAADSLGISVRTLQRKLKKWHEA